MDSSESRKNEFRNYYKDDGSSVKNIGINNFILKKKINLDCSNCSGKNTTGSNYCKFCGESLDEIVPLRGKTISSDIGLRGMLEICNIKSVLLTSGCSVFILFLISLLLKITIYMHGSKISSMINPIHILLGINLGSINTYSNSMVGTGHTILSAGLLVLLVLPAIALAISNIVFLKKENRNAKETFINSLGVGITYGLILAILSLSTKSRISSNDMFNYGFVVGFEYDFLGVLINSIIIGFLCSFFVGYKKKYEKDNTYLAIFKIAAKTLIIAYISIFVILMLLKLGKSNFLFELGLGRFVNDLSLWVLLSQVSAYIFAIANFAVVTINDSTIGLLNIASNGDLKLIIYAITALTALTLLLAGCKLRTKYKYDGIKPVLVLSISYSILMGILALFTKISINTSVGILSITNINAEIFIGFSVISAMISSFIYSFIVASLGYKLNVLDNTVEDKYE